MKENNKRKESVMLESGDEINANISGSCDIGEMLFKLHRVTTQDNLFALSGTKPYIVNLNQIECIVGEWNKEKTEYGLRIFYASGNSAWIGKDPANDLLLYLENFVGDYNGYSNLKAARIQFINK